MPLLERLGLKRSPEQVAAEKAAKEKAAADKAAADQAAREKAAEQKAAADRAADEKAAADKVAHEKAATEKAAADRAAQDRAAQDKPAGGSAAATAAGAAAGLVAGGAAAAKPATAPTVPPASPWARPTPAAGAAAAGAAAREGSIPPGPYKPNVSTSATSASSATETKPLYRPESPAAETSAKADGPQSRFPQPAVREASPEDKTDAEAEDTAGPSTAVLPAVPVAPVPPKAAEGAKPKPGVARRTRKARLRLSRLDPWSVMKTSFLFSIAAGIMLVVAVYVVWTVLSTSGLFDSVNEIVASVVSTPGDTTPFRIEEYINTQKVMGVSALIACVDVVIFTALATLGSFLYNLAATMLGGLEITLAED